MTSAELVAIRTQVEVSVVGAPRIAYRPDGEINTHVTEVFFYYVNGKLDAARAYGFLAENDEVVPNPLSSVFVVRRYEAEDLPSWLLHIHRGLASGDATLPGLLVKQLVGFSGDVSDSVVSGVASDSGGYVDGGGVECVAVAGEEQSLVAGEGAASEWAAPECLRCKTHGCSTDC